MHWLHSKSKMLYPSHFQIIRSKFRKIKAVLIDKTKSLSKLGILIS